MTRSEELGALGAEWDAESATHEQEATRLETEIVKLKTDLALAQASNVAKDAEIARLTAEIARLTALLAAIPAPTPVPIPASQPVHWAKLKRGFCLEQYPTVIPTLGEFKTLYASDFRSMRMHLRMQDYLAVGAPIGPAANSSIQRLLPVWKNAVAAGILVTVDFFGGVPPPYLSNTNDAWLVSILKALANYMKTQFQPDQFVFGIANEPRETDWWDRQATKFVSAVRAAWPEVTISATPPLNSQNLDPWGGWSMALALSKLSPLADKNVVYPIHFYEDRNFTYQAVSWGDKSHVRNMPYPNGAWDKTRLRSIMAPAKIFADKGAFVIVQEFGCVRPSPLGPDEASRNQWLTDVRSLAEEFGFGWSIWEADKGFGFLTGTAPNRVPDPKVLTVLGLGG